MNNFSLIKKFLFAFAAILLIASCDDEFDTLNSNILDGDIHSSFDHTSYPVIAYDRATGAVATSSFTTNFLGTYDNPVFGKTTASYITQLEVASTNLGAKFTENITVDSVWVYVPYYTNLDSTIVNEEGETEQRYSLNQVYGDSTAPYKLKLRRNHFYLRTTDPATAGETQQYYSDQKTIFDAQQIESLLPEAASDVIVNGFSHDPVKRTARYTDDNGDLQDVTAETLAPGLFMYLDKDFFKNNIINPSVQQNLINNTVFKEYFRGISFYPEQIGDNSAMAALNFSAGYIKIKYTQDDFDSAGNPVLEDDGVTRKKESLMMTLNMTGVHVNLIETQPKADYSNALTNSDAANGDDRLYLKGGAGGSIALIDILTANQRQELRNMVESDTILVNEASLIFYLDETKMAGINVNPVDVNLTDNPAPFRIYLYDVNNKRPVYDYSIDGSTLADTRYNRYIYGGIPFKDSRGRIGYKIRLTNHVSNLVKYYSDPVNHQADSTNVKLGLGVTNLIDVNSNVRLRTPLTENWPGSTNPAVNTVNVTTVPFANAMNPFGVVLYGPNIPVGDPNYDKRLRLEIYYTKPERN